MPTDDVTTLADAYPREQARCRELLARYRELEGRPGVFVGFAVAAIEDMLRRADEAAAQQDLPAMIRVYQEMKETE